MEKPCGPTNAGSFTVPTPTAETFALIQPTKTVDDVDHVGGHEVGISSVIESSNSVVPVRLLESGYGRCENIILR